MPCNPLHKLNVVGEANDRVFVERQCKALQRLLAILAVHDELRDHRVVVRRDGVALPYASIDAQISADNGRA